MDDITPVLDLVFRWLHVVVGILWIGHLFFFNWVNANFVPTLDAETKKKVVPELMPRALFFFRWGAAWTWITGVLLLALVFYHGKKAWDGSTGEWTPWFIGGVALTFVGQHIYELVLKFLKTNVALFAGGLLLASGVWAYDLKVAGMGHRGAWIHLGAMFGTIMAFNVWFRIWPAQRKIIRGIKDGPPADPAVVALAGARSRHNTFMAVPLVFAMLDEHTTWVSRKLCDCDGGELWAAPAVILLGWLLVTWIYGKAKSDAPKFF